MSSKASNTIREILKQDQLPPAILFVGSARVRLGAAATSILKHFQLDESQSEVDHAHSNAQDLQVSDLNRLHEEYSSLSLFARKRILHIDGVETFRAAALKALLSFLQAMTEETAVCLYAQKLPASHLLHKEFKKMNLPVLSIADLKGEALREWTSQILHEQGIDDFSKQSVEQIIELADKSADKIHQMIQHLSLYVENRRLENEALFEVFPSFPDPNEFSFLDAVSAGNTARAEILLEQLLSQGKSPFLLLSLISRSYSKYILVKYLMQKGRSPGQIQEELQLKPWLLRKYLQITKRYGLAQLRIGLEAIRRADLKLKSKSPSHEAVFSELIFNLSPSAMT